MIGPKILLQVYKCKCCEQPKTTKSLRSFLGAYKILSLVIPNCSSFLKPLEKLTHGKKSSDRVDWTDESVSAFHTAQAYLSTNKSIVLPKEDDQLWIVTDGASSTVASAPHYMSNAMVFFYQQGFLASN